MKLSATIMMATLSAVAPVASRMMNREKAFWSESASRRAMNRERFNELILLPFKSNRIQQQMKRILSILFLSFLFLFLFSPNAHTQVVDQIYNNNIRTVQFYPVGDQRGMPVYRLNSSDRLELEFDDMQADYKSYYYTFVLCDYNWQRCNLNVFDYLKGFTQNRISTYRYSSIAYARYTHYQAFLPEQNCLPTRSGNYLLLVYVNGDTSKVAFTRQMLVVDQKASVSASVVQPFTPQLFNTHQRVKFTASLQGINSFSAAQQVKAVIVQNNRWDKAQRDIPPTFVRGSDLEFNNETVGVFPAGKEWRWLDLRSFRLQSDRVDSGVYDKNHAELYLKPDGDRSGDRYIYFPDYNGAFYITTYETINPLWQGDYANIHFSFVTPDGHPLKDKNIYLAGGFTGYQYTDKWKMNYQPEKGKYELAVPMKQGYYNYTFVTVDTNDPQQISTYEGNHWETENSYTIFIYYKSLSDRNDQLIGTATIDSRTDKPGFSF